ncbi:hypothetical protein [Variovorax atrisoli]|nr:hypothetical protein [Variovorax sp. 369]
MARLSFDSRKHAALDAARVGDVATTATTATMAAYRRTCALS